MKLSRTRLIEIVKEEILKENLAHTEDNEGQMARSNLFQISSDATLLHNMIGDNQQLPGWVQEFLALASDHLHHVKKFLRNEKYAGTTLFMESSDEKQINEELNQGVVLSMIKTFIAKNPGALPAMIELMNSWGSSPGNEPEVVTPEEK